MTKRIKFEEAEKKIKNYFRKLYPNEEIISIKVLRYSPGNFLIKSYKKPTWWDKLKGLLKKQEILPVTLERTIYFLEDKYYYRVWISYVRKEMNMENNNCCCRTCKYWTCEDFEGNLILGNCEIFDCLTVDEYICELYEPIVNLEKELKWLKES